MTDKRYPVIWIDGLMGAGKTTLVKALAERIQNSRFLEENVNEAYLQAVAREPERFAFGLQIDYLTQRYRMHKLAQYQREHALVLLDRGMPGDRVFCQVQNSLGAIDATQALTYDRLYYTLAWELVRPDVLVYLEVDPDKALERVRERGRPAENGITLDYLILLRSKYRELLETIWAGQHHWSGIEVLAIDWNDDDPPVEKLAQALSGMMIQT